MMTMTTTTTRGRIKEHTMTVVVAVTVRVVARLCGQRLSSLTAHISSICECCSIHSSLDIKLSSTQVSA